LFFKVLEKPLAAGSYVVIGTAAGVGAAGGSFRLARFSVVNNCQLRDQNNGVIGVARASGEVEEDNATVDSFDMAITGGVFIPEGTTGSVSLWCNGEFGNGVQLQQSQLLVLKIGGFAQ
jgi:hypothetical protein